MQDKPHLQPVEHIDQITLYLNPQIFFVLPDQFNLAKNQFDPKT